MGSSANGLKSAQAAGMPVLPLVVWAQAPPPKVASPLELVRRKLDAKGLRHEGSFKKRTECTFIRRRTDVSKPMNLEPKAPAGIGSTSSCVLMKGENGSGESQGSTNLNWKRMHVATSATAQG